MKKSMFTPRALTYAIIFSLLPSFLSAQIDWGNVREGENVEYCKSHKKLAEALQNPSFKQQYLQDQQELAEHEALMKANPNPTRAVYIIPVVFHVLHQGGSENISDEQILDQLAILNRDYRLQNADANNVQTEFNASNPNHVAQPADIEIEFRLATIAPDGTCFNGITRTYSSMSSNGDDGGAQVDAIKAGNNVYKGEWAGNKYLNIFICKEIGGAAGYTMKPNNYGSYSGTTMRNGIWILHQYVGSIGTGNSGTSRALTHEVGHWLNLDHTWGGTNNPGVQSNCDTDDGVTDTPNCIGVTSCQLQNSACGPKANVENYMDYSYCSKMFTEGQRDRMRTAIAASVGGRNNIWKPANLTAVGADGNAPLCVANFSASQQAVCVGTTVTFNDESYNNVQTRTWTFEGGTPTSSTAKSPEITYNTPGVYKVELTVSDGSTSKTKIETSYITVLGNAMSLPYYEGFEGYNATSDLTRYQITSSNPSSKAWELTTEAAKTGSKSLYVNNFNQTGDVDEFISPSIDLSGESSSTGGVTLSFRYAAAKKSSAQATETFKTYISSNCGESYVLRKTLTATQYTTTVSASNWIPSDADWKTVHVTNITTSYFSANFRFKFALESNGGNNLFIDDINLYRGAPTESLSVAKNDNSVSSFVIYPNPANSELNVSFSAMNEGNYTVQVVDLVGKIIYSYNIKANQGLNEVLIDTDNLGNGAYFVKVSDNSSSKTLQFVKQ